MMIKANASVNYSNLLELKDRRWVGVFLRFSPPSLTGGCDDNHFRLPRYKLRLAHHGQGPLPKKIL